MAITSSLALLQTICPLLYADAGVQDWLDLADQQCAVSGWGAVRIQAVAYLAAHTWTVAKREQQAAASSVYGGPVGALTSQRAGDLSLTFASPVSASGGAYTAEDQEYTTTSYGLRYLGLRNSRPSFGAMLIDADQA